MNTSGSLSRRRFLVSSLGLGAAAIAVGASPGLLRGASAQGGEIWYSLSDGTRLRSGPGLSYPIVTTLSAGSRVNAFEQARFADGLDWTRVTVSVQPDVLKGYVASKFFSPAFQEVTDPRFPIGSDFFVEAGTGQRASSGSNPA